MSCEGSSEEWKCAIRHFQLTTWLSVSVLLDNIWQEEAEAAADSLSVYMLSFRSGSLTQLQSVWYDVTVFTGFLFKRCLDAEFPVSSFRHTTSLKIHTTCASDVTNKTHFISNVWWVHTCLWGLLKHWSTPKSILSCDAQHGFWKAPTLCHSMLRREVLLALAPVSPTHIIKLHQNKKEKKKKHTHSSVLLSCPRSSA